MNIDYLLKGKAAKELYLHVKDLPVYDYHCHLSPEEIYNDEVFDNIGQMWLGADHYKWRLMRAAGSRESLITGNRSWKDKFLEFIKVLSTAAGSPLYHWCVMELAICFNISVDITEENAEEIWNTANDRIKENRMSPTKLMELFNVKYIATTDDITDTLEFHRKIKNTGFSVAPAFRTDNLLLIRRADYKEYIQRLSEISGTPVKSISDLKKAVANRLDFFMRHGCKFSDVGIAYFPQYVADEKSAGKTFEAALEGTGISDEEYSGFLGNMYVFLAGEYAKHDVVMQMHLAVQRNVNGRLFDALGTDCGGDCIGDLIPPSMIASLFNSMDKIPRTILYSLNPDMAIPLATVAASFRDVQCGAAWWFNDNKRGIRNQIEIIAENGHLGSFLGMLTDSRSFLSYVRHDYFRRILCSLLGEWVEAGEYPPLMAEKIAERICCINTKTLIEEE